MNSTPRNRLTREESHLQTRARLLAAAQEEIARHGISAASVRNISEAAGFSQGAFYSNFQSKEAMLLALMEDHMQQEAVAFQEIIEATAPDDLEKTLVEIAGWLRTLQADRSWSMLALELQMHANRNAEFAAKYDESKSSIQTAFAKGFALLFDRHHLAPRLDPLQMAMGFNALWSGLAIQGTVASAQPADEVVLIFLKALIDSANPKEAGQEMAATTGAP
ncbi:MAG: TetR/AcrR family transcriptional regulator [Rhodomicrobium sp.]